MAKMRVIRMTKWQEDGIQVDFEAVTQAAGFEVTHIERATPVNKTQYDRLEAMGMYDEFNVSVTAAP